MEIKNKNCSQIKKTFSRVRLLNRDVAMVTAPFVDPVPQCLCGSLFRIIPGVAAQTHLSYPALQIICRHQHTRIHNMETVGSELGGGLINGRPCYCSLPVQLDKLHSWLLFSPLFTAQCARPHTGREQTNIMLFTLSPSYISFPSYYMTCGHDTSSMQASLFCCFPE